MCQYEGSNSIKKNWEHEFFFLSTQQKTIARKHKKSNTYTQLFMFLVCKWNVLIFFYHIRCTLLYLLLEKLTTLRNLLLIHSFSEVIKKKKKPDWLAERSPLGPFWLYLFFFLSLFNLLIAGFSPLSSSSISSLYTVWLPHRCRRFPPQHQQLSGLQLPNPYNTASQTISIESCRGSVIIWATNSNLLSHRTLYRYYKRPVKVD